MAYVIKRSNQTVFTTVDDKEIDRTTIALALVGRGAVDYGTDFAQNFVRLYENFASPVPPMNPMVGTLWYCTSPAPAKLKVYLGNQWVSVDGDSTPLATPNTTMSRNQNGDTYANAFHGLLRGVADSANILTTPRVITAAGDAKGEVVFDGSRNVTLSLDISKADVADRLSVGRKITLTGPVRGETVFDGSMNVTIPTSFQGEAIDIDITGNAETANRWAKRMTLTLTGDVLGSTSFDGSRPTTMTVALRDSTVKPGTYNQIEVNEKGIVVGGVLKNRIMFSDFADQANLANTATRATRADTATIATFANSAAHATTANSANTAGFATSATSAVRADSATRANTANSATFATTAGQWDGPIRLTLGGSLTGNVSFDGTTNVTLTGGLNATGVTPGVYTPLGIRQFRVGADGRIIEIANGTTDTGSGTETDLSGLVKKSGDTMTGNLIAPRFQVDSNFYLAMSGSNPAFQLDSGYRFYLDRTSNDLVFQSNNASIAALFGNGSFAVKGDIIGFNNFSDRRIKREVQPLTNSIDVIKSLNGYSYEKHKDITGEWVPEVGVVAQEVQTVIPTAVNDHDGTLVVKHEQIIAHLIESVKALEARIAELEQKDK